MLLPRKPWLWLALGALLLLIPISIARYRAHTLARSIRKGNLLRIKELLRAGADVNVASPNGTTALMIAADTGDLPFVRELIARGAEVNAENADEQSALYWAASAGHLDVVRELLGAGAVHFPWRAFAKEWHTPKAAARRAGHLRIAQLLAERERLSKKLLAETQAQWHSNREEFDPNRLDRWRKLLEQGANPNHNNVNGDSLMALAAAGDEEGLRLMLDHGGDPTFRSRSDADPERTS